MIEPAPVTFVAVCFFCGRPLAVVPHADVSAPWHAASLWCYLAQVEHKKSGQCQPTLPLVGVA
jgi:hypothetical protein